MERPTRTFTTSLGNTVEIKTYLTQGERVQVQKILAGQEVATEKAAPKTADLIEALARALTLAVTTLNGSTENVIDTITNQLPASEYDEISAEVLKLVAVDLATAK